MAPDAQRRLAAILHADVVGYSRLMAEDEDATVRLVTAYREEVELLVHQHRGELVDFTGDNFLVEFGSAVAAVECATEIQHVLNARNAPLPGDRKMQFRMGIHLGDVRVEGERIYGDGINIAHRIQELSDTGGISISGTVYEQVHRKLSYNFEDLGEQTLKNIPDQVQVYRVHTEAGNTQEEAQPVPGFGDRPSLAVLPFESFSAEEEQAYLAEGMTEDLIALLAKTSGLVVISRTSTFAYKEKARDIREIGRELGVSYLVEGSVRKLGDRIRISVQLIDAPTGAHLWTERFERPVSEMFELQDTVVESVVAQLPTLVLRAEVQQADRVAPESLDAWALYHRAFDIFNLSSKEDKDEIIQARDLVERALDLDPDFPQALALRGDMTVWLALAGLSRDRAADQKLGVADGQRAVARAPEDPDVLRSWAAIQRRVRGVEASIPIYERALELNPNDASVCASLGLRHAEAGHPQDGIAHLERAIRLSPKHPIVFVWYQYLSNAYVQLRRYGDALAAVEKSLLHYPASLVGRIAHAWLLVPAGRLAEARMEVKNLREELPGLSLARVQAFRRRAVSWEDELFQEIDGYLRQAGLE